MLTIAVAITILLLILLIGRIVRDRRYLRQSPRDALSPTLKREIESEDARATRRHQQFKIILERELAKTKHVSRPDKMT